MRPNRGLPLLFAALVGVLVYFVGLTDARAVPSFARKYQTSCQTCHTVYPGAQPVRRGVPPRRLPLPEPERQRRQRRGEGAT